MVAQPALRIDEEVIGARGFVEDRFFSRQIALGGNIEVGAANTVVFGDLNRVSALLRDGLLERCTQKRATFLPLGREWRNGQRCGSQ